MNGPRGRSVLLTLSASSVFSASTIIAAAMTIPQALSGSNLPLYGYRVQHVYPHDANAFTQGLQYVDGVLYEGTGLNGRSSRCSPRICGDSSEASRC